MFNAQVVGGRGFILGVKKVWAIQWGGSYFSEDPHSFAAFGWKRGSKAAGAWRSWGASPVRDPAAGPRPHRGPGPCSRLPLLIYVLFFHGKIQKISREYCGRIFKI